MIMSEMNGHTLKSPDQLRSELEGKILTHATESWDAYAGPYWDAFLNGSDRVPARSADPPSKPSDRAYGRDWPRIRSILDLDIFRSASRKVCAENAYARGSLQGVIDSTIGHGGTFSCEDEDIAAYLNDWSLCYWAGDGDPWDHTPLLESHERQCLRRLLRDGEAFLLADEDEARFLDPERCRDYSSGSNGWSYGIQTDPYDVTDILAYSFVDYLGQQTLLPPEDVIHVKIDGTDSTVKRGVPFYSWDTLQAFLDAQRTRSHVSLGTSVRAAISLLWEVPYGDVQDVAGMTFARAMHTTHPHDQGRPLWLENSEVYSPTGLKPIPLPVDYTSTQLQAVQADLRAAGAASQTPEYMISGDSSNANFASTKESGTPFVRRAEGLQARVRGVALRLGACALRHAVRRGILPREIVGNNRFDYKLPDVVVVEPEKKIVAITGAFEKGLLTRAEARVALGYSEEPGDVT